MKPFLSLSFAVAVAFCAAAPLMQASIIYDVTLNTQGLPTGTQAFLYLIGTNNNSVTFNQFTYGGGSGPTAPVTLSDASSFFSSAQFAFVPGSAFSFDATITTNGPGAGQFPDEISFALLDGLGNPLPTNDPSSADTLVTWTVLNPGSINVATFSGTGAGFTSTPAVQIGGPAQTPEPRLSVLLGAALLVFVGFRKGRAAL